MGVRVLPRVPVEPTTVQGFTGEVHAAYNEAVGIEVTFKESATRTAIVKLLFVVIPGLTSPMIIGHPTLLYLRFALDPDGAELRKFDLMIPLLEKWRQRTRRIASCYG